MGLDCGFGSANTGNGRFSQYALTDDGYEAIVDTLGWTISKFVTDDDSAQTVEDLVDRQQ